MDQILEEEVVSLGDILEISREVQLKYLVNFDELQRMMFIETCRSFFTSFMLALVRRSEGISATGLDIQMLDAINFNEFCASALTIRLNSTVIFVRFITARRRFQIYDADFLD